MSEDFEVIHHYVKNAVAAIDELFGEGYAKKHPELIRVYVEGKGRIDLNCTLEERLSEIGGALSGMATNLYEISTSIDGISFPSPLDYGTILQNLSVVFDEGLQNISTSIKYFNERKEERAGRKK